MKLPYYIIFGLGLSLIWACNESNGDASGPLFQLLTESETGIHFINQLENDDDFNIYKYRNFYNGAGVAIGDINQDGLMDIYLTANLLPNRLFLNKGNFKFEDITDAAGVSGRRKWSTGVSMADVNGDGWVDIYVCNSGDIAGDNKQNELYINQGDLTFVESAESYGLADQGYSTHAAFFDYDKDGDLDLYLLNNSYKAIGSFNPQNNLRQDRDSVGGDKLFRNNGDQTFSDVSDEAGIYGSVIGFGLGVTVGDINDDGWQDIYVSNDFFERDYIYLNLKNGRFRECLTEQMHSISGASMGADMADINNDGRPDVFVTEMLPEPDARLKTVTTFENWDKYQINLQNDYYHQFTRNMLQLNNGDNSFSEIGRLAGVEATDWSWGALITDLDNDGWKDIFVANGIYQDLTDQDFLVYINEDETKKKIIRREGVDYDALIAAIPSNAVPNYAFAHAGTYQFENKAVEWGLDQPSFSNGAAYADLDNDGDLDLVVNNVNMPLFVYQNHTDHHFPNHHYLKISLKGKGGNKDALGAQVSIYHQGQQYYQEQMPMRGFQSSMDPRLHFGIGQDSLLDSLEVIWPDGSRTLQKQVTANQHLTLEWPDSAQKILSPQEETEPLFNPTTESISIRHKENDGFIDFNRDRLLYHMRSNEGPAMCQGDFNGDGRMDVYLGGAKGQEAALLIQQKSGAFTRLSSTAFVGDSLSEDIDCACFDADGDGDTDLYVVSGGNDFSPSSSALRDRLYLNTGNARFEKSSQALPTSQFEPGSCVRPADYDQDGDMDLFVGIRLRAFLYGVPMNGYILENDGQGKFRNVSNQIAPQLKELGLITDAQWWDYDQDQDLDLVVVGEWMPISVFKNESGAFRKLEGENGLDYSHGFWQSLAVGDVDNDGDPDLIAGNHGLNSRFSASREKPVCMYVNDFDGNSMAEQIICLFEGDSAYPLVLRHDLITQLPDLKQKYLKYENYQNQTVKAIFGPERLEGSLILNAYELRTSLIINKGNDQFEIQPLPIEAQFSPVFAILAEDFDADGHLDILLGGNQYRAKPEVGIYDASFGLMLAGTHAGFKPIPARESGLYVRGEIRQILSIHSPNGKQLLVARNNDALKVFDF